VGRFQLGYSAVVGHSPALRSATAATTFLVLKSYFLLFHVRAEDLERERKSGQDADGDESPADRAPLLGSKLVTEEQCDACAQHRPGGRDQPNFRYGYDVFLHGQL